MSDDIIYVVCHQVLCYALIGCEAFETSQGEKKIKILYKLWDFEWERIAQIWYLLTTGNIWFTHHSRDFFSFNALAIHLFVHLGKMQLAVQFDKNLHKEIMEGSAITSQYSANLLQKECGDRRTSTSVYRALLSLTGRIIRSWVMLMARSWFMSAPLSPSLPQWPLQTLPWELHVNVSKASSDRCYVCRATTEWQQQNTDAYQLWGVEFLFSCNNIDCTHTRQMPGLKLGRKWANVDYLIVIPHLMKRLGMRKKKVCWSTRVKTIDKMFIYGKVLKDK